MIRFGVTPYASSCDQLDTDFKDYDEQTQKKKARRVVVLNQKSSELSRENSFDHSVQ
jgi:hypothetical protein